MATAPTPQDLKSFFADLERDLKVKIQGLEAFRDHPQSTTNIQSSARAMIGHLETTIQQAASIRQLIH